MSDTRDATASRSGGRRSRRSQRTPFSVGFFLSAALHLLLVALYPFFGPGGSDGVAPPLPPDAFEPAGTEVIQLVELTTGESGTPDDPVETETPDLPTVDADVPDFSDTRTRFPDRYRSPAERLRAGQGDPRLWQGLDPSVGEPTVEEVARLRLLTAIESMNDSALIAAERAARATDWTYTDDDGNRWGVSPGKLHLGKVSIPLPFGFGPPPDYSGDQARRAFEFADIDRAAGTRAAREAWKERLEAMRERREQRRAEEQENEGDPPRTRVRPDTTGVSR